MPGSVALDLVAQVMGWDGNGDPSVDEFAWLKMMSSIKYDGYADFRAGVRFLENLAVWLRQFPVAERQVAYDFFKRRLVYISPAELKCLIEIMVPEVVTPQLRREVAHLLGIKPYEVWKTKESAKAFQDALRRTLFVGMSDGSRIDMLRRANAGKISPEQIVAALIIDDAKWEDLGVELAKSLGSGQKFDRVYLIEDFTGSGTTFARYVDGKWKGKLHKFEERVKAAKRKLKGKFPLKDGYDIHIHHYISSHQASAALRANAETVKAKWKRRSFGDLVVSEGIRLPASLKLSEDTDAEMLRLCREYFDVGLDVKLAKHLLESNIDTVRFGYAACTLPLILDHNTPNNTIPLLWAETNGDKANAVHAMEPLFRRRDRHG